MTSPTTPGDALNTAAKRLAAQREAARTVSREIAERRASEAPTVPIEAPERAS